MTSLVRRTRREVKRWALPTNPSSVRVAAVAVALAALVDERDDADTARQLESALWQLRQCSTEPNPFDELRARAAEKYLAVARFAGGAA